MRYGKPMMENHPKIFNLNFNIYSWEQRKFGDIFVFERPDKYMIEDDHYEESGIPVLTANKAFILGYKNETGAYDKGDCIIFDDFTLDSKYVDFPYKVNSSVIKILTAKDNSSLKFDYYLLNQAKILQQGHARHYISVVQPTEVNVPKNEESLKIEKFLSNLDSLITLHQRKQIVTKSHRKKISVLFCYSCEQRKLADLIVKGGSGGTPSTTIQSYYSGNIPFLSITDITNSNGFIFDTEKHITKEALDSSAAWIVPSESISLAMYASVGKVAILKQNIATSQAFYNMVFDKKETRDYCYQYLKMMEENNSWSSLISTGTQSNLNADKVKNLHITMPPSLNEQKIIGTYFNRLDSLITLHQREKK